MKPHFIVGILFIFAGFFMLAEMKYEIILEKIENAFGADDKFATSNGLRVKKYNRTTFVADGKFELKVDLDDSVTMKLFMLNWQGNQYKRMFEKDLGSFCETIYQDPLKNLFNEYQSQLKNKVAWKTCPYPKGENEMISMNIQGMEDLLPPYLPGSEKWQAQMRFYKDEVELGGYNVYAILRNENSLMNGGR